MPIYVKLRQFCEKQTNSTQYPFEQGQVLVPMLVWDNQMIRDMKLKRETLRYLGYGKLKVQVAFIPVEEPEFETAIQCYYKDVNEFLNGIRIDNRKHQVSFVSLESLTVTETEDGTMYFECFSNDIPDFEEYLANEELKSFILELDKQDERFGKILEMLSAGQTKAEIIESLDLKKTQGYKLIKKALDALNVFYKS